MQQEAPIFKNVSTKVALFAFDTTTGAAKTGDAANITAYVSKDYGASNVLADTSATEQDATNAKGWYLFDVAQAETNADALLFTAKSTTANISVVGQYIFTTPNRFTTLVIDAAGLADANMVKVGPTGAGTAQTARDLGASVLLSSGAGTGQLNFTAGIVQADAAKIATDSTAATNLAAFYDAAIITGSVTNAAPTTATFRDSTKSATDSFYNGSVVVFRSGTLAGIARKISAYSGTTKEFTVSTAFPVAPAQNDTFAILGRIE